MKFKLTTPIARDNVLTLSRAYAKYHKIKLTTVSRYIRGDMYFLDDFRTGKISLTFKKYDEIIQWFTDHWPEGTPMPLIREFEDEIPF